jgi:putative hydrolase of the HAD superfamily
MILTHLFFDLDGTLYPNGNGLWEAIGDRMDLFMRDILQISPEQVPVLREAYFHQYGTTMKGLVRHHKVNADEFLEFVHQVPLENFLAQDPTLEALLSDLPYEKWIFTNANQGHSQRVLAHLGISHNFSGILDVTALDLHNKPEPEAFRLALIKVGSPLPRQCVLIDDQEKNLLAATEHGMHTIHIHHPDEISLHPYAGSILDVPALIGEIKKSA